MLHLLAYLVLMGWFGQLYEAGRRAWIAVLLVALGALLEVVQGVGRVRSGSWLADESWRARAAV